MSGFLDGYVKTTMEETLREEYPHIRHPALVKAKVTERMAKQGEAYVTLQVLTEDGEADGEFPLIPYVRTPLELKAGDTVIAGLLYGGCSLYVFGRCPDESD